MKADPLLFSVWLLLGLSDRIPVSSARSRPSGGSSGGSRPSGGSSGGSRPSSQSRPSFQSSPSSPSSSARNPSAPAVRTPSGPIPSNQKSAFNPSPSFKPLNSSGAPTVRSGGGGFGSTAKTVLAGAAAGAALTIAAGYFLYGGRHSSPYCRGSDEDRFASGRCPRGSSSSNHQCKTQIPLCEISETVRGAWNFGESAPPKVDVLFDKSVCSVVPLPTPTSAPVANANTNATPTLAPSAAPSATTDAGDVDGVVGESGLDDCLRKIVASGGCTSYGAASMFQYDDSTGTCGCCSSTQVTTLGDDEFQSAVYSYRSANSDLGGEAPRHCISGSTMYYPSASAGETDVAYSCECGTCGDCGASEPRYLDWSGPYAVPNAIGESAFVDAAETQPRYDPVDTCMCNNAVGYNCYDDTNENGSSAAGGPPGMVAASSVLVLLLLLVGRH